MIRSSFSRLTLANREVRRACVLRVSLPSDRTIVEYARDRTVNTPGRNQTDVRTFDSGVSERVADAMFALSTPSRVQILCCLLDGAHSVSELVARLGQEQSAVSHQLRVLLDYSLVQVEQQGRRRLYTLSDEHVVALVSAALRHVEQRSRSGRRGSSRTGTTVAAAAAEE
jgi:DNA-binding transcriptional ArsR family regulator